MNESDNFSSRGSLGTVSERKLISFSQEGDRDAFACLYDIYVDRIHRYVFFRVIDPEVAEDITSLVFLRVWENLGTFQSGRSPFAGWLYRIAHNAVIDHYRTRKAVVSLEEVAALELCHFDEADEKLDLNILSQELPAALKELTDTQRDVLILRFLWGLTTSEIAQRLGKQQGAIRAVQMRALRRLAQFLSSKERAYTISDLV